MPSAPTSRRALGPPLTPVRSSWWRCRRCRRRRCPPAVDRLADQGLRLLDALLVGGEVALPQGLVGLGEQLVGLGQQLRRLLGGRAEVTGPLLALGRHVAVVGGVLVGLLLGDRPLAEQRGQRL